MKYYNLLILLYCIIETNNPYTRHTFVTLLAIDTLHFSIHSSGHQRVTSLTKLDNSMCNSQLLTPSQLVKSFIQSWLDYLCWTSFVRHCSGVKPFIEDVVLANSTQFPHVYFLAIVQAVVISSRISLVLFMSAVLVFEDISLALHLTKKVE